MQGTPVAGDQVVIEANAAGVGDNTNSRLLAGLQALRFLDGGTATYQDAYGVIVGDVGSRTRQAEVSSSALKTLLDHAVSSQQQVSGVNLDEEAADLMRFQQAYQANAQVVATGTRIFEELINAVRQ
jgi:flagellar hook-associated protein 1 FlgK